MVSGVAQEGLAGLKLKNINLNPPIVDELAVLNPKNTKSNPLEADGWRV